MADQWTDRLSEYVDGDLADDERARVDAHLRACTECAAIVVELRQVIARAATLPSQEPGADLWPGIAARLSPRQRLVSFGARAVRRFSFTLPQLVAASLALMVLSGGAVWVAQHGGRSTSLPPVAATDGRGDAAVALTAFADPRYDEAVADLERALRDGRTQLDPQTVQILEANLRAIDAAIDQSRRALAADPANVYLNNHLADAKQRKLALLRHALIVTKG
jgi:putative zinc finger protein